MEKELISIVIVAGKNRKDKLVQNLSSIYKSDYKKFEILLVDNSEENSLEKFIIKKFPKINYIKMPYNTGIFAFNVGFANAEGQYILLLDDDCSIEKKVLSKIIHTMKSIPENVGIISLNVYQPSWKHYYYNRYLKKEAVRICTFAGGACVIRKEVLNKTGYFDDKFFCWVHEDDLSMRILNAGFDIYFEKDIIIYHHEEKSDSLRKKMLFLSYRNRAWFNLKNFSFYFFPILILRDLIWIFMLPLRKRNIKVLAYSLTGYLWGYLNCVYALNNRKVVSYKFQKRFLNFYLFNKYERVN